MPPQCTPGRCHRHHHRQYAPAQARRHSRSLRKQMMGGESLCSPPMARVIHRLLLVDDPQAQMFTLPCRRVDRATRRHCGELRPTRLAGEHAGRPWTQENPSQADTRKLRCASTIDSRGQCRRVRHVSALTDVTLHSATERCRKGPTRVASRATPAPPPSRFPSAPASPARLWAAVTSAAAWDFRRLAPGFPLGRHTRHVRRPRPPRRVWVCAPVGWIARWRGLFAGC